MPIINTFRGKALLVNLLGLVLIIFASGCSRHTSESTPAELAKKSGDYYREALAAYNNALARSRDAEKLRFELGRLYFEHGDFTSAIAEFKKTDSPQAKKLLAISLYKKGDFADALEAFSHNELKDDESLYFYGLTAEKLNLFDEALKAYLKINSASLKQDVRVRIEAIEKEAGILHIKEADPKVYAIIKDAPTLAEYPQAGALILYCDETIEITPDNRQISVLHYLVKILNERGKEKFSETHVDYDSTYEKVKLVYARTIRPDGRVVDVGARHIRDVSRYLNFPLYSNARAYIISFPEIAEGSIIEYKVILHNNRLINEKDFMTAYMLQDDEPIIAANFTLRLPIDRGIHLKTVNERYNDFDATLSPVVKQEGNFMVYKWQFKNIPQIIPEPSMPPMAEVNPTFFVSTFNSWDDIYKWWWGLASGKMNLDSQIRDKVRELTRNKKTEKEKAAALYNFCAQKIRYVAVEYGQAGYEPHNVQDIFKNKYGDCKDQALLLVTMLRTAGIKAYPVLVSTKGHYGLYKDFPMMMFNHAIAATILDGKTVFMDPTAETCSFGDLPTPDHDREVLILGEYGYKIEKTPLFQASHNLLKQEMRIKIKEDGSIKAEKTTFTFGIYDQAQRYRALYTQPELIEEVIKEAIQSISIGAQLEEYKIENASDLDKPVVLSYKFNGPEYWTEAGNLRIMPQLAGLGTSLVAKDKRKYAIEFEALDKKESFYEIQLPSAFTVKYIPPNIKEESPWFDFSVEYTYAKNKILVRQKEELKRNTVLVEEYPLFREFLKKTAKRIKQRIVLEQIKDAQK